MANFLDEIKKANARVEARKAERAGALQTPTQTTAREDTDKEISEETPLADTQSTGPATVTSSGSGDGDPQPVVYVSLEEIDKIEDSSARLRARIAFHREQKEMKEKLATLRKQGPVQPELPSNLDDLDLGQQGERSDYAKQLDDLKARITLPEAYTRWAGKGSFPNTNRRESIMISCPVPGHTDSNPSAWGNTDKDTWYCGGCAQGGDQWDIAAWGLGFPVPGYKQNFNDLMMKVGEVYGIRKPEVKLSVVKDEPEPEIVGATVTQLPVTDPLVADLEFAYGKVDVSAMIPDGDNFLKVYTDVTGKDDVAPAFNLACGLLALSCVVGHRIKIKDSHDVAGNIAIVLVGSTGAGKSRATRHAINVVRAVAGETPTMGYQDGDVRIIKDPGSDEYLVDEHIVDPPDGPVKIGRKPVKSLIQYGELNKLMMQARRPGQTILARLFEFLDTESHIETGSRGNGKKIALNAYASFVSTTQPELLSKLFSAEDVAFGAGNRLNFVYGDEVAADLMGDNSNIVNTAPAQAKLMATNLWISGASLPSVPLYLDWGVGSREQLNEWGKTFLKPYRDTNSTALLNRADLHAKKYALLFAVNAHSTVITTEHVSLATRFVEFLCKCYSMVNKEIGRTDSMRLADQVLEVIDTLVSEGKTPTQRLIYQRVRRHCDPTKLKILLDSLISLGMLRGDETKHARGPATRTFARSNPTPPGKPG